MTASDEPRRLGLRERKKQKTREAIQRAALRLFTRKGYEETTVEDIAEAAEISPSTFFNYFPTKEDVVLYDIYDPLAIDMILRGPKDESLRKIFEDVIKELAGLFERDKELILVRARLMLEVPELRERILAEMERTQLLLVRVLAERVGRKASDFELRVVTRALVGGLYEAVLEWVRTNGREPLAVLTERALRIMERGLELSSVSARQAAGRGEKVRRRRQPAA